jgi:MFS family permease
MRPSDRAAIAPRDRNPFSRKSRLAAASGAVMRIPIWTDVRELSQGPRRFLVFSMLNVISWQCLVAQVMVLFARAIEMPQAWVGVLQAILPLSMICAAFTITLVDRLGPRRLMVSGWTFRNMIILPIFAMPWVIGVWGREAGWWLLLVVTAAFCVIRSLGVGGWFPWLHEVVPPKEQGRFFAVEVSIIHCVNIFLSIGVGIWLARSEGYHKFFWIYGLGVLAGFVSLAALVRVPGGKSGVSPELKTQALEAYLLVFKDAPYRNYVLWSVLGLSGFTWLASSTLLFMRDTLGFSDSLIMIYVAMGSLGAALSVTSWGKYADRHGSVPAIRLILFAQAVSALAWLLLVPGGWWVKWLTPVFMTLATSFGGSFMSAANRGMLCRVQNRGRVGYTHIWVFATSMVLGVTPIMSAQVFSRWQLNGFRACFIICALVCGICVIGMRRLPLEEGNPPEPDLASDIRPLQPVRALGRVIWITLGLEERMRARDGK